MSLWDRFSEWLTEPWEPLPRFDPPPEPEYPTGNTMIMLRNTYGRSSRWTDLGVQEVALRIRNSEVIPLTEGDWLSPWNVDTFMSKDKFDQGRDDGGLGQD